MENEKLKIGIYGLGLIGGSILKALHNLDKYELYAVSKSSYMLASDVADKASDDISILKDCDVVFVCTKMRKAKQVLKALEDIVRPDAIVSDVCSIKGFLKGEYKFNFISSHPMAGTEKSGYKNSSADMFKSAKWIIAKDNEILTTLIKEMGAKPLILDADTHDNYAAQISHLPMLIAMALFNSADDEARIIGSSGFRDTTRLSMTNPDLASDMLTLNRKNIEEAFKVFVIELERIIESDEENFRKLVEKIAKKRLEMYDSNGKNAL